jgi:hypothetical protein
MAWTKRALVAEAFNELALAGFTFDIGPDEQAQAIRRMDTMVAGWERRGVSIGYALPTSPTASDPGDDSGIPDNAAEAVYLNLARSMAPSYGKQLPLATLQRAKDAFDPLLWDAARPASQQLPAGVPLGAGAMRRGPWRVFTPEPEDIALDGCELEIEP